MTGQPFDDILRGMIEMFSRLSKRIALAPVTIMPTRAGRDHFFRVLRPRFNVRPDPAFFSRDRVRGVLRVRVLLMRPMQILALLERPVRDYFGMS